MYVAVVKHWSRKQYNVAYRVERKLKLLDVLYARMYIRQSWLQVKYDTDTDKTILFAFIRKWNRVNNVKWHVTNMYIHLIFAGPKSFCKHDFSKKFSKS